MKSVVLDGKTYVKASEAAKDAGYTPDYVGQLCRGGKVDAQLVGRSWYVDQNDLRAYRSTANRTAKTKSREQVRAAVATQKRTVQKHTAPQTNRHFMTRHLTTVHYEEDTEALIPNVRKLSITSEAPPANRAKHTATAPADSEPDYTIEHEGEKVLMSGTLDVVDVGDEEYHDADAVLLHADVLTEKEIAALERAEAHAAKKRHTHKKKKQSKSADTNAVPVHVMHDEVPEHHEGVDADALVPFSDKLEQYDVAATPATTQTPVHDSATTQEAGADDEAQVASVTKRGSRVPVVEAEPQPAGFGFVILTACFCAVLTALSLLPETRWTYYAASGQYEDAYVFESHFGVQTSALKAYIIDTLR